MELLIPLVEMTPPPHSLQWCLLCSSACTNRPHRFCPIPLDRAGLLTAVCVVFFTPYFQLMVVVSEAEFPSAFLDFCCPVTHYFINVSTQLFLTHSLCHFLFVTLSLSVSFHLCLLFFLLSFATWQSLCLMHTSLSPSTFSPSVNETKVCKKVSCAGHWSSFYLVMQETQH